MTNKTQTPAGRTLHFSTKAVSAIQETGMSFDEIDLAIDRLKNGTLYYTDFCTACHAGEEPDHHEGWTDYCATIRDKVVAEVSVAWPGYVLPLSAP